MALSVNASALFARAIRPNFWPIYETTIKSVDNRLADLMDLALPSDKASEIYGYADTSPVMRRWDEGQGIPTDAFLTHSFTCRNWKWGVGVPISAINIADDQLHLVVSRCKESALSAGLLKERVFYQLLTGGAVPDAAQLLPAVPLAADGVAMFSATNGGGGARFGRTGGNLNTPGLGQGSAASVQGDLFTDLAAFAQFTNTQNQPLFPPGMIIRKLTALFNPIYIGAWTAALQQLFNVSSSGNAAPSNVTIDAGLKVVPIANQKITTNYSFVCATEHPVKAIFWQEREGLVESVSEPGNSDIAREYDQFKFYTRSRGGASYSLPQNWMRNG